MANNQIRGERELIQTFNRLGKMPPGKISKAVRAGAKIEVAAAKLKAPEDTGMLKKGIVARAEKSSRSKYKKFYDVTMDRKLNDFYVSYRKKKTTTRTGRKVALKRKRFYYPASQEYGFFAVNGRYIPGFRYLRDTADRKSNQIKSVIINDLASELDKLMR